MRKILHYGVFLLFIALFWQCESTRQEKGRVSLNVKVDVAETTLKMGELFTNAELINLFDEPIGKIIRLYYMGNKLFVWTTSGEHRIHIYDIVSGKHNRLGRLGEGPDEFSSIGDMVVDRQWLYILDFARRKVTVCSHEGIASHVIVLPDWCDNFFPLDSVHVILRKKVPYGTDAEFKLNVYKEDAGNLHLVNQYMPIGEIEAERDFFQLLPLYRYKNEVRFTASFSDTIYSVKVAGYNAAYQLDFAGQDLPHQKYKDEDMDLMAFAQYCMHSGCIWNINCVMENQQYLFFTYRQYKKAYGVFFDKQRKQSMGFDIIDDNVGLMTNGIHMTEGFLPMYITDSSMFFVAEAWFLYDLKKAGKQPRGIGTGNMKQVLHNITPSDNPVVLKYNFRN